MKGYLQIYTGNGKGKTTAALGLILRAAGAGLRVFFGQFIKHGDFSEILALRDRFPEVTVAQFGLGRFIPGEPSPEDIRAAQEGLTALRAAMLGGDYDLVVADEAGPAVKAGLFGEEDLLDLADARPDSVELILTGRHIPATVIDKADLVTEMKAVRHYFESGVKSRKGIEE